MTLLFPLWLIALLPWAAVAVWLLWGRAAEQRVPFVALWRGPMRARPVRRRLELPPPGPLAMLLAALAGILAAAGPVLLTGAGAGDGAFTIIYDRGATASAGARPDQPGRGEQSAAALHAHLLDLFGDGPVTFIAVPDARPQFSDRQTWIELVRRRPATAMDTRDMLASIIRQQLAQGQEPLLLVSDRRLDIEHERLIQVAPDEAITNVGILHLSAREAPAPQAMVRIGNDTPLREAMLTVVSDEARQSIRIELPPQGQQAEHFIDLPALGPWLRAELDVPDDLPADNAAWATRGRDWPVVQVAGDVPPAVGRIVQAYRQARPAGPQGPRVSVLSDAGTAPAGERFVAIAPAVAPAPPDAAMHVAAHPLTRDIDWAAAARGAQLARPPEDWQALVQLDDRPVVAVRETPQRAVWIGFEAPAWPASADFVIFWTNVLDWLAEASDVHQGEPVALLGREWSAVQQHGPPPGVEAGLWPGLYEDGHGALRAVQADRIEIEAPPQVAWRQRLDVLPATGSGGIALSPALLLIALALAAVALAVWRPASLTGFSVLRTV